MPGISWRWKFAAVAVAGCAGLAWVAVGYSRGEREAPAGGGKDKATLTPWYVPARQGCGTRGCHESAPIEGETYLCRCTEYNIWVKEDKHADACNLLSGPRGQEMAAALRYDVTTSDACLSCHSVVVQDPKSLDPKFDRKNEGVSCAVCHGPYREWRVPHGLYGEYDTWRKHSRAHKEQMFGMTDLWDPVKRATLCASCHIGNVEQKKFVTHEMYAAGHPPLPGFEVTTFSEQMPRHWQYLREKPKKVQELLRYDGTEREQTKLVLVGAAVNLRESMKLLAHQAQECSRAKDPDRRALDLANFDCYSCHHDLKSPSWRQKRGFAGRPGRVPMRTWPAVLVPLAVGFAAADSGEAGRTSREFTALLKKVEAAFDARPFGDPEKVAAAAGALARWAGELAGKVNGKPCGAAAARKVLTQLPGLYQGAPLDYDSARQVAWALKVLRGEQQAVTRAAANPQVEKVLQSLDRQLKLELPAGRKRKITDEAGGWMRLVNDYDPDPFRRALRDLAGLLGGK
jgi:hypothetical protein